MIPAWLQAHLEATGVADTDGVARAIRARTCPRCHAPILTGLDADRCALAVTVDPQPTDVLGEALALVAGRDTYDLAGLQLIHRDQWRVAGRRRHPVLADHLCNAPLPRDPNPPLPRRVVAAVTEEPCF